MICSINSVYIVQSLEKIGIFFLVINMHEHLSTSQVDFDLGVRLSTIHTHKFLHLFCLQLFLV